MAEAAERYKLEGHNGDLTLKNVETYMSAGRWHYYPVDRFTFSDGSQTTLRKSEYHAIIRAHDKDEDWLLDNYGKTSWELAHEAEQGYDHPSKVGPDGKRHAMSRQEAGELFERKLREICTDEEWAVYHRRLHPELYPPEKQGWRERLRSWWWRHGPPETLD